jgi:hypothetical protein
LSKDERYYSDETMRNQLANKSIRSVSGVIAKLAVSLTVFAFAIHPLLAQNPAGGMETADKDMVFDAVTIHPVAANSTEIQEGGTDGNRFYLRNSSLTGAIVTAIYDRGKVPAGFVDSLPKWIREEKFDLTAKVSASDYEALQLKTHQSNPTIPMDMLHPMLQNILKEMQSCRASYASGIA